MNKRLTVWIFQTGEPLHSDRCDHRPMRAINLANVLVSRGHKVVIWSSDFFHQEKRFRTSQFTKITVSESLKIILVPSPGYSRNLSLKRFYDHLRLASNLNMILRLSNASSGSNIPDVAVVGYPPIEAAYIMSKWLRRKKVPFTIDAKDLWPEILAQACSSKLQVLARALLLPYNRMAYYSLSNASFITSITPSFLSAVCAMAGRETDERDSVLPLVSPKATHTSSDIELAVEWLTKRGIDPKKRKRFVFIGTISRSFEFKCVVSAFKRLVDVDLEVELVICGIGESRQGLIEDLEGVPNVYFPGWVDSAQAHVLLTNSLASIAPYKNTDDFRISIPNKVIDSLSSGLPVITGLEGELQKLVCSENVGIFCQDFDDSWFAAMYAIVSDTRLREEMSQNCTRAYSKHFEFERCYNRYAARLELLAHDKKNDK